MACVRLNKVEKLLELVGQHIPKDQGEAFLLAVNSAITEINNMGYERGIQASVDELMRQYRGCQPGTLVSYHIAAEVLSVELLGYRQKEYDDKSDTKGPE